MRRHLTRKENCLRSGNSPDFRHLSRQMTSNCHQRHWYLLPVRRRRTSLNQETEQNLVDTRHEEKREKSSSTILSFVYCLVDWDCRCFVLKLHLDGVNGSRSGRPVETVAFALWPARCGQRVERNGYSRLVWWKRMLERAAVGKEIRIAGPATQ